MVNGAQLKGNCTHSHALKLLYCSALPCLAMACNALQCLAVPCNAEQSNAVQCLAVPCNALQCLAMQCSVLPCNAVSCIIALDLHCTHCTVHCNTLRFPSLVEQLHQKESLSRRETHPNAEEIGINRWSQYPLEFHLKSAWLEINYL